MPRPAVFLDRDGTIIEERGYTEHSARDLLDYVGHLLNR